MIELKPFKNKTDCLIWTGSKNEQGYGRIKVKGKLIHIHRFAYCVANGLTLDEIDGLVIRHKCDNPSCINPSHLETGTPMENVQDRVKRGRSASGEKNGVAKLTARQVEEIISTYVPNSKEFGGKALGIKYGVHQTTISKIIRNDIWSRYVQSRKTKSL
ncbi:HNH endonuclease [Enterobacter hormaechei]|uniref:HNH endonuclease n=1 Tax=Enterobacter hormaechei TaxID=158836 RepID=UPI00201FFC42|nr:HNH endonuclease [Enterobacter hormaechei]MCL8077200.1 HNH endonuclease [Enterobacter hormaechei]MCM6986702.1 HNH endonuclease [Enterobacter hormaechei]MCM7056808.1 HNH endonuclease [Enterobacter hormaechei]